MDVDWTAIIGFLFAAAPGIWATIAQRKTAQETHQVSEAASIITGFDELCKSQQECIARQEARLQARDADIDRLLKRLAEVETELQAQRAELANVKQENAALRLRVQQLEEERADLLAQLKAAGVNHADVG